MKITIDISQVVYGTGVSIYTRELVRALLKVSPENEYVLYAGVLRRKRELTEYVNSLSGSFTLVSLPLPPTLSDVLWNYTKIVPFEAFTGHTDVVHVSDWTEPFTHAPKVTTVHDISPILYPELTHPRIRRVFNRKLKLVKANTDLIIVPSLSIEKDLIQYGISPERIYPIPEAPNPELLIAPQIDIHKRFTINSPYILMVGTAARKNVHRGIDAFHSLKLKGLKLVVVGENRNEESIAQDVIFTGFINTHELANLYRNAEVFLYPSLYEGFGLPILEAYALGCPVVTSNLGCMQEIGEAAVLVNPYDTADIAKGMLKAVSQKKSLIIRGKELVKDYTWDRVAHETSAVYKKAYEK